MYAPPEYVEQDVRRMAALIRSFPFGLLVSARDGLPSATHLPFVLEEQGRPARLLGHMARANPHWRDIKPDQKLLAIFSGPGGYITPAWYSAEQDVPTWNYQAVHVCGRFSLVTDVADLRTLLAMTVNRYEQTHGGQWSLDEIDQRVVARFERGVAAFRIDIEEITGATKHSQDKHKTDIVGVLAGLDARDYLADADLATAMRVTICR